MRYLLKHDKVAEIHYSQPAVRVDGAAFDGFTFPEHRCIS